MVWFAGTFYLHSARCRLPSFSRLRFLRCTPKHLPAAEGMARAASRQGAHRLLKEALQVAVSEWRLLPCNPANSVKAPRAKRKNMRALDTVETAPLLESARPYRLFLPVMLAVTCGLRRGEICALRWRNVDLSGKAQLAVLGSTEQTKAGIREKETKSDRARTVALTPLAIEELRRHKKHQAEELFRCGVRQTDDMYVVAQADGQPLKPNSLTHEFVRFITRMWFAQGPLS